MRIKFKWLLLIAVALVPAGQADAAITNLQVTTSLPSPQPIGTAIDFEATATGAADYQFNVQGPLDRSFHLLRDFTGYSNAVWSTIDHEGTYNIQVIARNTSTGDTAQIVVPFTLTSRVAAGLPTISLTPHPLVVLYSAPPCPSGSSVRVGWIAAGTSTWSYTPTKPCVGGLSVNFYVAGMIAQTVYYFQQDLYTGPNDAKGPVLAFPTGPIAIPTPRITVTGTSLPTGSSGQPILLHSYISLNPLVSAYAIATDLSGNVVWYGLGGAFVLVRPVAGGTFMVIGNTAASLQTHVLQEIDLVGNLVRETNAARISEQLIARGQRPITEFHHDALRLPNGYTVTLGTTEVLTSNVQGVTGPVDIVGDTIVVLDRNFNLVWSWCTFDHLNINDTATLNETCTGSQGGCPQLLTPVNGMANDWTHSNALDFLPSDGSLLLSVRHQDKVLKINYANGSGDGSILFTLGKNGNFTMSSTDPYPWFSHQHSVNYESDPRFIDVFDNSNVRRAQQGISANSRGQVLRINTANKTASLVLNADLGAFSPALGSAQKLINGDYHFALGSLGLFAVPPNPMTEDVEVGSTGSILYDIQSAAAEYRSFRMVSLYSVQQRGN